MRKKLVTLLLLGTLLTVAACSGKKAEEPDAGTQPGPSQVENRAQPKVTPGSGNASDSKATPEPKQIAKAYAISDQRTAPETTAVPEPEFALEPMESEYALEELITSITMPEKWYTFSCTKDQVVFYSRGEEYGWLSLFNLTPVEGSSEVDSIIRDLSGAKGIVELIDTREEENVTRYVFVIHRSRYAMGEVEFLAQAGIISEEEALAQEQTELFIAYKVNGDQWWGFSIKSDVFGGDGLLDALEFEITFAEIK